MIKPTKKLLIQWSKRILLIGILFWISIVAVLNFQDGIFKKIYSDKIWIHRVNSIQKLNEVQTEYVGVELDLVYNNDKDYFDVNHPPAPSTGLSLENYFKSVKNPSKLKIWLDYKNLNGENETSSLRKLKSICEQYNISPDQMIVESRNPIFLTSFYNSGFTTSYYLPNSISHKTGKERDDLTAQITKDLDDAEITFISSNKADIPVLKEFFPNKQILTWTVHFESEIISPFSIREVYNSAIRAHRKYKLLSDHRVEIVLYKYIPVDGDY